MRRNQISRIPSEFSNLKELIEVDFSENIIEYLPSLIFKLKKLKKANLCLNLIRNFEIFDDPLNRYNYKDKEKFNIEVLLLTKNKIEILPIDFMKNQNLHKLKHLSIDDNPIKEITREILNLIEKNYKDIITFTFDPSIIKEDENDEVEEEKDNLVSSTKKSNKFV